MFIIHAASELAPIAKVGGLADVVYSLSKELIREGHRVQVVLPKYDCIDYSPLEHLAVELPHLETPQGAITIWSAQLEKIEVKLVEPLYDKNLFSRGKIYGFADETERFLSFCIAVKTYLMHNAKKPDALHLHDWHTAAVAALIKGTKSAKKMQIVLTLHNLHYQGHGDLHACAKWGLKEEDLQDPHRPYLANLLKAGILSADAITAVSPTYTQEIQTAEGGCGLDDLLKKNAYKLHGILNGIDPHFWNPASDPMLLHRYKPQPPIATVIEAKKANRRYLQEKLNLHLSEEPLVACISRLVAQKGPELIKHALQRTLEQEAQFVLLGGAGESETLSSFLALKDKLSHNKNLSISIDHDEELAHLIFAAADMIIIPSLFEPCGLTQLIAMRYGTIPLARKTGGLADTVHDIDTSQQPIEMRNGFTFDYPDNAGVDWALDRAISCYKKEPEKWQMLIRNALAKNFSWEESVHPYLELYRPHSFFAKLFKKTG